MLIQLLHRMRDLKYRTGDFGPVNDLTNPDNNSMYRKIILIIIR